MASPTSISPIASVCSQYSLEFDSTIPVVNLADYDFNRNKFNKDICTALHEVGFFAVVNPKVDFDILNTAYDEIQRFYRLSDEEQRELVRPNKDGQRGLVLTENAQGNKQVDHKRYIHFGLTDNEFPKKFQPLHDALMVLLKTINEFKTPLEEAMSIGMGERADYISTLSDGGDHLLRATHYPSNSNGAPLASEHTDIDFYTVLPWSTERGLQILQNGEWKDVVVPKNAFIINGGDFLQSKSNDFYQSAVHRVVAVDNDTERFSIVIFFHAKWDDQVGPTEKTIANTDGVAHFPQFTEGDGLARRLCEIGLANKRARDHDATSGLIDKIKPFIDKNIAAPAAIKTYKLFLN